MTRSWGGDCADDLDLPSECVHGTYSRFLDSILKSGLMPGGKQGPAWRNTVHFQPHAPGDQRVICGMRHNCEIAIWVDLREALKDNIPFYVSKNKVILTSGIDGVLPSHYIQKVVDLRSGREIFTRKPSSSGSSGAADAIVADMDRCAFSAAAAWLEAEAEVAEEGFAVDDYDAIEIGLNGKTEWGYLQLTRGQPLVRLSGPARGHSCNCHLNYLYGMYQGGSGWFPAGFFLPKAAASTSSPSTTASCSGMLSSRSESSSR